MKTLSLETCRLIDALGVKCETHFVWNLSTIPDTIWCINALEKLEEGKLFVAKTIPAYSLQELFTILPQIGEKLGWKKYVWLSYGNYRYGSHDNSEFTDDGEFIPPTNTDTPHAVRYITSEYYSHQLLDQYLSGGMTAVDKEMQQLIAKK